MTTKSIYDLALHEIMPLPTHGWIRKVAGGWIYCTELQNYDCAAGKISNPIISAVFVPYSDEFAPEKECEHNSTSMTADCINQTCNDCGATRRKDALHKGEWSKPTGDK